MSRAGMGGKEYDELVETLSIQQNPADAILAPSEKLHRLSEQLNSNEHFHKDETEFVGYFMGIPLWVDNRFDKFYILFGANE